MFFRPMAITQIDYNEKVGIVPWILGRRRLDYYVTNLVSDIYSHFEKEPPKTIDKHWNAPSAMVVIIESYIRRRPGTSEEEIDRTFKIGKYSVPYPVPFEIKTGSSIVDALWIHGKNEEYTRAQEKYCFNDLAFTCIKYNRVQYIHNKDAPLLIWDFSLDGDDEKPKKEKAKSNIWIPSFLPDATAA